MVYSSFYSLVGNLKFALVRMPEFLYKITYIGRISYVDPLYVLRGSLPIDGRAITAEMSRSNFFNRRDSLSGSLALINIC